MNPGIAKTLSVAVPFEKPQTSPMFNWAHMLLTANQYHPFDVRRWLVMDCDPETMALIETTLTERQLHLTESGPRMVAQVIADCKNNINTQRKNSAISA